MDESGRSTDNIDVKIMDFNVAYYLIKGGMLKCSTFIWKITVLEV